ncbi:energy-coupling factor ABC transporter ATP-binding protein [Clostridium tyrobutyricum]|uniref:energy-coupling factor ABC transporter ATP-binding protein n=1 Tax=Clostridium tyrobutyricum TaxID=1519 RepID=UPI001C380305|nr:ABC transporter ATP-binding protein [Clostridium tyrobutyricum]MBV4427521.1 energy-coupling factor ABC transporter ATP-binding protein [Clostridium tyrobutyricum]MBV4442742.1 energy-coupling factor ABC transporter ATP-binding protein [Clostridium tyrobutyricum]
MGKIIEIENLTWKYSNTDKPALDNVSLDIEENSFIGVCGPNEAGKTSLVSCIKGLIPNNFMGIYQGEVKLFGKDIKTLNTKELAEYVGFVFADPESQFTSMSVEEELAFGMENLGLDRKEIGKRIEWVSEITGLEDLLDKSPYDISGGQKQRVAIASVLSMQPKIVILDEPTSMLDPLGKDSIFEICERMKNELNMTIIMVEHTIDRLARLSDKMILLNNGKIKKYAEPNIFFDDIDEIIELGLNPPAPIVFLDKLKKSGLYNGDIKTKLEDVIEIARDIYKENIKKEDLLCNQKQ